MASLESFVAALQADRALTSSISAADLRSGIAETRDLNALLLRMIDLIGANDDGLITADEMARIAYETYDDAYAYRDFLKGHGNDNGDVETGFHIVQNDGAALQFRGRNHVDTVIDAIFHFGFEVEDGRYVNEDGQSNETTSDVAGWLNYYLNGKSTVLGTDESEDIGSGEYSAYYAGARNEFFYAGGGDDRVWADIGNDTVMCGDGNDEGSGNEGDDTVMGERGNDAIWGNEGNDMLTGGRGNDRVGGGDGKDSLSGDEGNDSVWGGTGIDDLSGGGGGDALWGEDGNDRLSGGGGADALSGGAGDDRLTGGNGRDTLSGGEGQDILEGGKDRDILNVWEMTATADTLIFRAGDSGRTRASIDVVEGFVSGRDKVDLTSMGPMTFEDIDFAGRRASCFFDGTYLRIDQDGDRATDMMIEFRYVDTMAQRDVLLA
jgi:Ca2+-binding RTX toxin-like protein